MCAQPYIYIHAVLLSSDGHAHHCSFLDSGMNPDWHAALPGRGGSGSNMRKH